MSKKFDLKSLIDKIDWVALTNNATSLKLPDYALSVAFKKNHQVKDKRIEYVHLRIGRTILEEMKWTYGDRIMVLHDPDNIFSFLLVKSDNGNGRTLCKETGMTSAKIVFKWVHAIALTEMNPKIVEYQKHKGYLHFQAPSKTVSDEE